MRGEGKQRRSRGRGERMWKVVVVSVIVLVLAGKRRRVVWKMATRSLWLCDCSSSTVWTLGM